MTEFWEEIFGWFNFENLYLDMIKRFDNAVFVEIGCWKGRSAGFMALNIKKQGKNIKFYAVDVFEPFMQSGVLEPGVTLDEFLKNTEPVKDYVTPIKGESQSVYTQFEDGSIDFLYIDGNHDYEPVKQDLELWYPKMKKGGVIAGHDYQWEGVKRAVDEFFAGKKEIDLTYFESTSSWLVNV